MASPTRVEYESLPPTLQRKLDDKQLVRNISANFLNQCFSTLERLRYAEAQAAKRRMAALNNNTSAPTLANLYSSFSFDRFHRTTNSLGRTKTRSSERKLNRSSTEPAAAGSKAMEVSAEDALWFSRLPAKVRQRHFSEEEQSVLLGKYKASKSLLSMSQKQNKSVPSLSARPRSKGKGITRVSSEKTMANTDGSSHKFNEEHLLMLDDYHQHMSSIAATHRERNQKRGMDRPGYSKTLSALTGDMNATDGSIPRSRRASTIEQLRTSITDFSLLARQIPLPASDDDLTAPAPMQLPRTTEAAPAAHYLDPEARMKLRLFASPSKFDEALEFGFPTLKPSRSKRNSTSRISNPDRVSKSFSWSKRKSVQSTRSTRTFFFEEPTTFFDDSSSISSVDMSEDYEILEEECAGSETSHLTETDDFSPETPFTPSSPDFNEDFTWENEDEADVTLTARDFDKNWPEREMTLRMTLTRPDLRADESEIYPNNPTYIRPARTVEEVSSKTVEQEIDDGERIRLAFEKFDFYNTGKEKTLISKLFRKML